jgi:hypothetical protein
MGIVNHKTMDKMLLSVRNHARGVSRRLRPVPETPAATSSSAPAPVKIENRRRTAMGIDVSPVHGRHCICTRCQDHPGPDAA